MIKNQGYKGLSVYIQARIIYDFTMEFCKIYIDFKSRTRDQMEQAARSGKQNISEGYAQKDFFGKLKLLKIARGSQEELLEDYLDFLRQKNFSLWDQNSQKAKQARNLVYKIKDYNSYNDYNHYNNDNYYNIYNFYKPYLKNPEEAANAMVCLINQTNVMIDNKIKWLERNMSKKDVLSPRQNWLMERLKKENKKEEEMNEWARNMVEFYKNKKDEREN